MKANVNVSGGQVDRVKTHWESVAETTRWGRYISEVELRAVTRAANLAAGPDVLLDVGCEGGRWSKLLVDAGWKAICTDINPEALQLCAERIPSAKCILVTPKDELLPCDDQSVSMILCFEVTAVIRTGWFIGEAARVLKRSGMLVGVFNNRSSIRGFVHHQVSSLLGRFDWYESTYSGWRKKLTGAGFRVIHEEGICWFPFNRYSDHPLVTLCTKAEKLLGLRKLARFSPWIVFLARKDGVE